MSLFHLLAKVFGCLFDSHTAQLNHTKAFDVDESVRRNSLADGCLVCPPDVDEDLIAGAETVVLRSGDILIGSKGKVCLFEYVVTEDPAGIFILLFQH